MATCCSGRAVAEIDLLARVGDSWMGGIRGGGAGGGACVFPESFSFPYFFFLLFFRRWALGFLTFLFTLGLSFLFFSFLFSSSFSVCSTHGLCPI